MIDYIHGSFNNISSFWYYFLGVKDKGKQIMFEGL